VGGFFSLHHHAGSHPLRPAFRITHPISRFESPAPWASLVQMRHPLTTGAGAGPWLCQVCDVVVSGRSLNSAKSAQSSAKRSFVTLHAGRRFAKPLQVNPAWPMASRPLTTSAPCLRVKRTQAVQSSPTRFGRATRAWNSEEDHAAEAQSSQNHHRQQCRPLGLPDLAELAAAVDRVTKAFLAQPAIPSEETTLTALRACGSKDIRLVLDTSDLSPDPPATKSHSETAASHLLDLDTGRSQRRAGAVAPPLTATPPSLRPQDVIDKISDAAYAIVTHPTVVITPQVLAVYVHLQAGLGKPESLPRVLELYASKPTPRLVAGTIQYRERNPRRLGNSVDTAVAETALDAAIEARNLDAAVGVVESSYASQATRRQRLVRKALLPASAFGATPVAAYLLASNLSLLQDTMDSAMATNVAFAGILAYVGFTASIGVVAAATANDQMKRVTWAPGTPLSQRWLREDERAAFDKIACNFGFSEQHRYGEEEGEEFQLLREFILRRGMILDAVELMPGMN